MKKLNFIGIFIFTVFSMLNLYSSDLDSSDLGLYQSDSDQNDLDHSSDLYSSNSEESNSNQGDSGEYDSDHDDESSYFGWPIRAMGKDYVKLNAKEKKLFDSIDTEMTSSGLGRLCFPYYAQPESATRSLVESLLIFKNQRTAWTEGKIGLAIRKKNNETLNFFSRRFHDEDLSPHPTLYVYLFNT